MPERACLRDLWKSPSEPPSPRVVPPKQMQGRGILWRSHQITCQGLVSLLRKGLFCPLSRSCLLPAGGLLDPSRDPEATQAGVNPGPVRGQSSRPANRGAGAPSYLGRVDLREEKATHVASWRPAVSFDSGHSDHSRICGTLKIWVFSLFQSVPLACQD